MVWCGNDAVVVVWDDLVLLVGLGDTIRSDYGFP